MSARNVIDGFEQLTREQCIDMSVRHVLRNGRASVRIGDQGRECSYAGIGCAAAPFLKPAAREQLVSAWLGLSSGGVVPPENSRAIQSLQDCHDMNWNSVRFVEDFKASVAATFPDYAIPEIEASP